jgi:ribonuclease R
VQVSRVDLDGRRIDFRLVRDGDDPAAALRSRRRGEPALSDADELAALKEADRSIKAASRGKGKRPSAKATRGARAAKPVRAAATAKRGAAKAPKRK